MHNAPDHMHNGPDRTTFVIEDNAHNTDDGTNLEYRQANKIQQYLDCCYVCRSCNLEIYLSLT